MGLNFRLIIEGKMPSLNEYIGALSNNRYVGGSLKKNLEHDIQMQILKQIREMNIENKLPLKNIADFEFTYFEKNKKRDKDNIASCKKYLFDAMVRRGVLNNDGWKWVGNFKDNFELSDEYKVIIDIKER